MAKKEKIKRVKVDQKQLESLINAQNELNKKLEAEKKSEKVVVKQKVETPKIKDKIEKVEAPVIKAKPKNPDLDVQAVDEKTKKFRERHMQTIPSAIANEPGLYRSPAINFSTDLIAKKQEVS